MSENKKRPLGRPRKDNLKIPTKDVIIKTATSLFLEKGFKHVSVDEIAAKSNVTKASVYYYYVSKTSLFTETVVQLMERITMKIDQVLQTEDRLYDQLLKVTKLHLEATFHIDIQSILRGIEHDLKRADQERIYQAEANMYGVIEQAFTRAMEKGEIRSVNPIILTRLYLSLLMGGNHIHDIKSLFQSGDEAAEHIIDIMIRGVQKD